MKLKNLLEKRKHDKKYREKIKSVIENLYSGVKDRGKSVMNKSSIGDPKIVVRGDDIGLENFRFIFGEDKWEKDQGKYRYDSVHDVHEITLNILYEVTEEKLIQKFNSDHGLKSFREILFHELTHAFDEERIKKDKNKTTTSYTGYFNDPKELNAFYQGSIDKLDRHISNGKIDPQEENWDSFENFINTFLGRFLHPEVVRNITDENRKRIIKRVYQYWEDNIKPMT